MKEVFDSSDRRVIQLALQRTPILFLGPHIMAKVTHAYYTGIDGVWLVFIEYGPYALRGVCIAQEPEIQIYLDLNSILTLMRQEIRVALQEGIDLHDNTV